MSDTTLTIILAIEILVGVPVLIIGTIMFFKEEGKCGGGF